MRSVSREWRARIDECLRVTLKSVDLRVLVPSYVRGTTDAERCTTARWQRRITAALQVLAELAPNLEEIDGLKRANSLLNTFQFPRSEALKVVETLTKLPKLRLIDTIELFDALGAIRKSRHFSKLWATIGPNLEELSIDTCKREKLELWSEMVKHMSNL